MVAQRATTCVISWAHWIFFCLAPSVLPSVIPVLFIGFDSVSTFSLQSRQPPAVAFHIVKLTPHKSRCALNLSLKCFTSLLTPQLFTAVLYQTKRGGFLAPYNVYNPQINQNRWIYRRTTTIIFNHTLRILLSKSFLTNIQVYKQSKHRNTWDLDAITRCSLKLWNCIEKQ